MKFGDVPDSTFDGPLIPFYKYVSGKNIIRFIPDNNGEQMRPLRLHWISKKPHVCTNFNSETGKFDVSPKTCQYCKNKVETGNGDVALGLNRDLEVVVVSLKKSIIEAIPGVANLMTKVGKFDTPDDFNSLTKGVWFEIVKSGSGFQTKYKVEIYAGDDLPDDVTEYIGEVELPTLADMYPPETEDEQLDVVMGQDVDKDSPVTTTDVDDDDDVPY